MSIATFVPCVASTILDGLHPGLFFSDRAAEIASAWNAIMKINSGAVTTLTEQEYF
jgi:hypothetical protein